MRLVILSLKLKMDSAVEALKEKNIKEAIFDADVSLIEANKKHILLQKKHAFSIHAKEYIKKTYKGFGRHGFIIRLRKRLLFIFRF